MFQNYTTGVQIGHNCDCHKPSQNVPEQHSPATIMKDELGNIKKLQWAPDARFTINITSDTNISIVQGSQILNRSGLTPETLSGWEGLYAYNIVDTICWKYTQNSWVRLPNIITANNGAVITFGNDQAKTKISIKNFRGETIFSDTEDGNIVPLTIDDQLADLLMQGFYNLDVYQITANATKLIRRIPVSIGQSQPTNKPVPINPSSCHNNNNFVTDNTLSFKNGVLSVNVGEQCQPGSVLPISGNAVFEFAQPRNMIVEADIEAGIASMSSIDIYNYQMFGGEITCLVNGVYLSLLSVTHDNATFKELLLHDNILTSYLIIIDNVGKIIEYKSVTSPLNSDSDLNLFKETLTQQMSVLNQTHDADIQRMDSSIGSMNSSLQAMQEQIGDLKVTEKIVELYDNYNSVNSTINQLNKDLDSKLEESDVADIVNKRVDEELSDDKLQDMVNAAVSSDMRLDGGVVE